MDNEDKCKWVNQFSESNCVNPNVNYSQSVGQIWNSSAMNTYYSDMSGTFKNISEQDKNPM